jgi:drug/metabolite transporter (DMT)-like permease
LKLSPAILAIAGVFVLSIMDALIKHMGAEFGTLQIVLLRFGMGALVILAVAAFLKPGWPSWEALRANGLRGFLVVYTALAFFYGLKVLPLAEALALSFLSPIFVAILGVVLLKEKAGPSVVLSLCLGIIGMLLMAYGLQSSEAGPRPWIGILAAVSSAFSYGLSMVLLRARAMKDPVVTIVAIQHVVPAAMVAVAMFVLLVQPSHIDPSGEFGWRAPSASHWLWFLAMGCCGAFGHLMLATAFAREEAARLAPLDFSSLIWAVLFGYLFFNEVPGLITLFGVGFIIAGGIAASRKPMPHAANMA